MEGYIKNEVNIENEKNNIHKPDYVIINMRYNGKIISIKVSSFSPTVNEVLENFTSLYNYRNDKQLNQDKLCIVVLGVIYRRGNTLPYIGDVTLIDVITNEIADRIKERLFCIFPTIIRHVDGKSYIIKINTIAPTFDNIFEKFVEVFYENCGITLDSTKYNIYVGGNIYKKGDILPNIQRFNGINVIFA